MPVKNEPHAEAITEEVHNLLKLVPHEVLLQTEEGISNAVWHGIQRAKGKYVVVMDSDGSHNPTHIPLFMALLNHPDIDVVTTVRKYSRYPLHRKMISLACAWFTRTFLGLPYTDPLTAYIAGKREHMGFEPIQGCKFALEILARTPKNRVAEYPVSHIPREGHKSKLKPTEGIYLLKQLLSLKKEVIK